MTIILTLIIVILVTGLVCWAVQSAPVLSPFFKQLLMVLIALAAALYIAVRFL